MPHTIPMRVLEALHDHPWAIAPRALNMLIEIVERPQADLEAVAARIGRRLPDEGDDDEENDIEMRGNIAVLGIEGPIFRYANLFTQISGATSVQRLATSLQSAVDNPAAQQILLNVNSPGGQIDGIAELADMIRQASATKPVTAYVDGMAASAGYWLAAAAGRIAISESSLAGSIGVVASIRDNRGAQERQGVKQYEIVSSVSPYKRPDVATQEGRAQIQEMIDALAEIFVGRVAQFRNTTADNVIENFGQGKMLIARRAIAAGMADEITNFEPLVTRLAADYAPRATSIFVQENPMANETTPAPATTTPAVPVTVAPLVAPLIQGTVVGTLTAPHVAERQRISAILALPEAQGRENLARTLATETDHDPETARRILASAPVASQTPAPPQNPLAVEMARINNPVVGVGAEGTDDAASEAAKVIAYVPASRRVKAS